MGTDGKVHVVYELMLANASSYPVKLTSLEVLDGNDHKHVLKTYSGDELAGNVTLLGQKKPATLLAPSSGAIAWFQLEFEKPEDVPNLLAHRLTCEPLFPNKPGVPLFDKTSVSISENLKVDKISVPVIGPPLEGDKWIAIGGIGTNLGHRRSLLPINDELWLSQRYANDWMQLDEKNTVVHGDVKKVINYEGYGKRALAVADATVVEAIDRLPDQIIGKPSRLHITEFGGNYVILDLGNKRYAFYAHLKPGSVKVKAGDKVTRGQEVGRVGNVGNSFAPHLHFHICDQPSPLGANGIPFVIDSMTVRGKYKSMNQYIDAMEKGKIVDLVTDDGNGGGKNEMPIAGVLVDFPVAK
jgi:Peptidase family M23